MPKPGSFLAPYELPLAWFNLAIAATCVVWKTVGMAWLPLGLGAAYDNVFTGGYYPRRAAHETEYNFLFAVLYGGLGTLAQISSVQMARHRQEDGVRGGVAAGTKRTGIAASTADQRRFLFGTFHVLIAAYHCAVVWSGGAIGKTALFDTAPPAAMWLFRVLYAMELVTALDYLLWSQRHRRKVALDALSFFNNAPMVALFCLSAAGVNHAGLNEAVRMAGFAVGSSPRWWRSGRFDFPL